MVFSSQTRDTGEMHTRWRWRARLQVAPSPGLASLGHPLPRGARVSLLAVVQAAPDWLFNRVGVFAQFVIPEADDAEASLRKPASAFCVILSLKRMLPTVEFDYEPAVQAKKINDKRPERNLSAKLIFAEASIAEL